MVTLQKIFNMKSICSSLLIVTFFAVACNNPASSTTETAASSAAFNMDSVKAAIAASNQMYSDAFIKGDSTLLIDRYSADACLLAPDMPAMCGSQAIAGFYRAAYNQMGVRNLGLTTTQVYGSGDYVTEEGTYELFAAENKSMDKGKFLVLWKKTDAGWKMYRDIFNSDNPPPPAK